MAKPTHFHVRAYDEALRLLVQDGQADAQGRGHTPEARQILSRLYKPAERAKAKALIPPKSREEQDWKKARDDADDALSLYVRFRDTKGGPTLAERTGHCVTSGNLKRGDELQCGHWRSRKHFGIRWHEFNVAAQSAWENSPHGGKGNPVAFEAAIQLLHGDQWPNKLRALEKFNARKPSIPELQAITEKYRNKLIQLKIREGID